MLDLRDLTVPVIAAPMAGGPSTPALAAAVSEAGGLGFLAAGYKTADKVAQEIAEVRAATSAPIGVNFFRVEPYEADADALTAYRHELQPEADRWGVELGDPRWDDDHWDTKVEVVLDLRPDVVSFTFGCPSADLLARLATAGILTTVTVTTLGEAREAAARGAGSLCVQGPEAGGHRGTWDPEARPDERPLHDLLDAVRSAVDVPLVAAGGITDAADTAAVIRRGAVAAQAGTAYLLADEAGTNPTHRRALTDRALPRTDVTRAFTGRWARGLANRFMAEHAAAPAGYPHLHHLTAPLRAAAVARGDVEVAHLWAGTRHADIRAATAVEITRALTP